MEPNSENRLIGPNAAEAEPETALARSRGEQGACGRG